MGLPDPCEWTLTTRYPKGPRNQITDVPGVLVGHTTLRDESKNIHTGVTAILPHGGNLFYQKVMAGCCVINGFGKSAGLIQVEELGTIESPILMTNTLSVGTALTAAVRYMLEQCPEIGVSAGTVNCIVTECNDGALNDIRGLHVKETDVLAALCDAGIAFEEGDVGAGTGMICMGLKGGIGSASRILKYDGRPYTLGAIALTNFGSAGNLRIDGRRVEMPPSDDKKDPAPAIHAGAGDMTSGASANTPATSPAAASSGKDKGSVIIVLATDLPLSDRQLKRTARRAVIGLGRVGSYIGNGSGDIAIAFSTGNLVPQSSKQTILETRMILDSALDRVFEATAETVEEAVISSLFHAHSVTGIRGRTVPCLHDCIRRKS